jgi:carboxypeptidase Q
VRGSHSTARLFPRHVAIAVAGIALAGASSPQLAAQAPSVDAALRSIEREGTENSHLRSLAQTLLDSIGPRLTGTPGMQAANDWAVAKYAEWGIEARNEQYGTWDGWRRGITHLDLLEPRVRTLDATMLAWSAGSGGVRTGEAVLFPPLANREQLERWLATARGAMVLIEPAEVTCRPIENWERWGRPAAVERVQQEREAAAAAWTARLRAAGVDGAQLVELMERAGVAALLTSNWSEGWGVSKIYNAGSDVIPFVNLSCEDYGLVFRLAENRQGPVLRLEAEAASLGPVPVSNTIAFIPGTQLPDEYVLLSAHFDSWDGASGATDNGTGTVVMMEAMRILKEVYPNPKRTILVGHWNGEEQGLNGSTAFAADHPEIVEGMQVLLNQDNGTGRIATVQMEGFGGVEPVFRDWLAQVPEDLAGEIELRAPGTPSRGGSDHSSFVCYGAPAFFLSSRSWDYGTYTWHTDLDTFDKIVFDEVRDNAVLVAMLAYLAAEHPERLSRERAVSQWPRCRTPQRTGG